MHFTPDLEDTLLAVFVFLDENNNIPRSSAATLLEKQVEHVGLPQSVRPEQNGQPLA